ncbi:MAG: thiamine phosphate synthase [Candidatus Omnitrophica bacterium]|nr:thiamine phosphate synthase [Candidatus Omnitrophota bacterium]
MLNVRSCSDWRLYVILDPAAARGRELAWIAERAIRGGADVLQLRNKTGPAREIVEQAARLLPIAHAAGVALIINDRADLALACGADGVHLGQDDLPAAAARQLLGAGKFIGKSTHTLEQARAAEREPVDYLAIGPVFATPTKPDYEHVGLATVRDVAARVRAPFLAIGGLDAANIADVALAGAPCVAVVRAVCAAADPEVAARQLRRILLHPKSPGSAGVFRA